MGAGVSATCRPLGYPVPYTRQEKHRGRKKKPCMELFESCQAVLRYYFAKSEFYEINEIIKHKKKTPESPIKQGFQAFLRVFVAFYRFSNC